MVFDSLYEVKEEKEILGKYWVYDKDHYPYGQETLIVIINYDSTYKNSLKKAQIYINAIPSKFLTIKLFFKKGKTFELLTDSVDIAKFLRQILPIIHQMGKGMLELKKM